MKPSESAMNQLYKDIPVEAYKFVANNMGYPYPGTIPSMLTGKIPCTLKTFEKMLSSFEFWKTDGRFSTFKLDGEYCLVQQNQYYNAITKLIGSAEYQKNTGAEKNLIVDEQKRLYKQLTTTKP